MKRVVITGAAGFIGSHLSETLLDRGYSIIGIDKFKGGYQAAKVAHEKAMLAGPVPVRIVRAAQFHELVERRFALRRMPWSAIASMRIRPPPRRSAPTARRRRPASTQGDSCSASRPPHPSTIENSDQSDQPPSFPTPSVARTRQR